MLYSNNKMVRINLVSKALFYFSTYWNNSSKYFTFIKRVTTRSYWKCWCSFYLDNHKNRKNKKFVITMCGIAIVGVCILATLYFTGVFDLFGDKRADGDNHLMVDKNYGQLHGDILRKIGCLGQAMELKEYLF